MKLSFLIAINVYDDEKLFFFNTFEDFSTNQWLYSLAIKVVIVYINHYAHFVIFSFKKQARLSIFACFNQ